MCVKHYPIIQTILIVKNLAILLLLMLAGCSKETIDKPVLPQDDEVVNPYPDYTKYTILKAEHYCDKTNIKSFSGSGINFKVRFDSTAIYTTTDPANQADINKLYGFTEGTNNHVNSARIGWCWLNNSLRLYAYTYSNSIRTMAEITRVEIGAEISCSISVSEGAYLFKINDQKLSQPRSNKTPEAAGYWQYPYFGGDEVASHNTYIYIKDLQP